MRRLQKGWERVGAAPAFPCRSCVVVDCRLLQGRLRAARGSEVSSPASVWLMIQCDGCAPRSLGTAAD